MSKIQPKVFGTNCKKCKRLSSFLKDVSKQHPDYFAKPVPAFGDENARLCIAGLAPGMHGAKLSYHQPRRCSKRFLNAPKLCSNRAYESH